MTASTSALTTSAFPYAIGSLLVILAIATVLAWWWGFQEYRDGMAERLDRAAAREVHEARHHYVAAIGTSGQRSIEGPTGQLEPAEIAKLLGGGR